MNVVKQFSVSLVNRPGVLANVSRALAEAKVNIIALTISDSVELGVLRMIVNKPDVARNILKRFESISESDVLWVDIPNRPGSLATVVEKLSTAHINILYAYVTVGGGKATAVLKVQYPEKAMRVLKGSARKKERSSLIRSNYGR
ncbi:MAG: ACT domain-containing protein [Planctomycetes bacterium]|nr:ACT domain-containing protein [Planctomycetota bacterium]